MIIKIKENVFALNFKDFGSIVYFIRLKNKNILIDTSSKNNENELLRDLNQLKLKKEEITHLILTHNHWDHIENLNLFKKAKIYDLKNIKKLAIKEFKIIKTPGHTLDSLCILYKDILFSGDTLFNDGFIGRTDFPESSQKDMKNSLNKLKKIKFHILCPGH